MKDLRSIGILSQLSWVVAMAVLVPLGLGLWLDHHLATSPLFIFVGALLGILTATVGIVRITTSSLERLGNAAQAPDDKMNQKEDEE